jgi:hypothetical protein
MANYCHTLAKITRWGFYEIMDDVPIAAGLQIINAEAMQSGSTRYWRTAKASAESLAIIDQALAKPNEPRR